MVAARIAAMACAIALVSCGGTVKFDDDDSATNDTTTTDTSAADTLEDIPADLPEDLPEDSPEDSIHPDPVEDTALPDIAPECITAGCQMYPDGGLPCCAGLDYVASCPPWDTSCVPIYHCVDCGNGTCDPHEAAWSCLSDCAGGCDTGSHVGYSCGPLEGYDCSCEAPPCTVDCQMTMGGTQWQNSCTDETYGMCNLADDAECRHIGTETEGWYYTGPMGGENLIVAMPCANHWMCHGYD